MLPPVSDLKKLRDLLLAHAVAADTVQSRVLEYLFKRVIAEGQETDIGWDEIYPLYTPEELAKHDPNANPKVAVSSLMRDLKKTINAFYDGRDGKPPNAKSKLTRLRPAYISDGNYTLDFTTWKPRHEEPELVPIFWKPHLPPEGMARTLYPEPIFLMDEDETYFRNSKMGTSTDPSALAYLNIQGKLTPGYSYVPSGIVQSLLLLGKTLRRYDKQQREDFAACEVLRPATSRAPGDHDLIVLATPTTTNLVETLQGGLPLTVDREGVHIEGEVKQDSEREKWGVCTRTRENYRPVTMIAARHGRSIEGITRFLAINRELTSLLRRMGQEENFPDAFQILFRMEATKTAEGPSLRDATVAEVYVDGKRIDPA